MQSLGPRQIYQSYKTFMFPISGLIDGVWAPGLTSHIHLPIMMNVVPISNKYKPNYATRGPGLDVYVLILRDRFYTSIIKATWDT